MSTPISTLLRPSDVPVAKAAKPVQTANGRLRCVMALFKQSSFTAGSIRSLCWRGDELVDWVGGCRAAR